MNYRVSQISLTVIVLDEFDAPQQSEQTIFTGDKDGTAIEKAVEFLNELPKKLEQT